MANITFSDSYSVSYWGSISAEVRFSFNESYTASTNKTVLTLSKLEFKVSSYSGAPLSGLPIYGTLKVAGTTVASIDNGSQYATVAAGNGWYEADISHVDTQSVTVTHNADGTKNVTVELTGGYDSRFSAVYAWYHQYATDPGTGHPLYRTDYIPFGISTPASATMALTSHTRSWTVSYNKGAYGTGTNTTATKYGGTALTLKGAIFTRTGYTQDGWSTTDGGAKTYNLSASYTTDAAITLYPHWSINSYTVTTTKGDNIASVSGGGTYTYGTSVTVSATLGSATGYNYSFDGWYSGSTKKSSSLSYTFTLGAANVSLTAKATRALKTYTVSYSANGGSGAPSSQTKTHGVALTLSSTKPTKANTTPSPSKYTVTYNYHGGSGTASADAARTTSYTFSKWNTASDGSGTNYNSVGSYTANAGATLYARYTSSTTTAAVTLPTPTRSGYSFSGWYTAETGGTKVGNGGASYTPSANITLHAQWTGLASTISSCSSSVATQGSLALTVSRKSTAYYHKATFKIGSTTLATSSAFATSLSYTVPRSWFDSYPNDTSKTVTVSVQTYTTSACTTTVGSAATTTFTVTADADMKPTVDTGFAPVSPYNTGTAVEGCSLYVKGYSKAQVTFDDSKIHMANGAVLASKSISCQGVTDSTSPYLTPVLNTAGTTNVVRTVTDSRGRSTSYTYGITVTDYAKPKLSGISVFRCNSGGTADEDGTYLSIKATRSFTSLGGWNSCTLQAQHKAASAGSYGTAYTLTSGTALIKSGFSSATSYHVKITATDRLGNTAAYTVMIPTQKWAMKFRSDGNGVAFGKAAETSNTFEVTPDWTTKTGTVQASGNVVVTKPTGEAVLQAYQSTSGVKVTLDSTGSTNSGVHINGYYDGANFVSDPRWLIYRNGSGDTKIEGGLTIDGSSLITRKLPAMSGNTEHRAVRFVDADNIGRGGLLMYRSTSASYGDGLRLHHARTVNGATTSNMLTLYVNDSGSGVVTVSHPNAWRTALGIQTGNTLSFGTDSYVRWAGDWRNTTNLWFTIPLNMSCTGLTATVSGSVIVISNNTRTVVALSSVTPTCYVSHTGVTVNLAYSSAPSYAVASGLANVQAYGLTITFS